jgi:hypothetical protein
LLENTVQENQVLKPLEIEALSINLTSEVGADDALLALRIVPDGRDGNVVFARTLRINEEDDGRRVRVDPASGERLQFRSGSVHVSIQDVDRYAARGTDGYARITNTIWTWLAIGNPTDPKLFRYLLAASRRMDGTHFLLAEVSRIMGSLSGGFIGLREQYYSAISLAEILTVALGRTVDLLDGVQKHFSVAVPLPAAIETRKESIREIRNAFEHIEDRALGNVRGKPHPDALSVFEQDDFFQHGKLTYGSHSIDLRVEVPQLLLHGRQFIYDVAVEVAGDARAIRPPLNFFG